MPDAVHVALTWSEVMLAVNAGTMRRVSALRNGQTGVYGARDEACWDNDINGALAELGCAKWANVFWSGMIGITSGPDVGRWQVRSKTVQGHRLVVRPSDSNDEIFISVLVRLPSIYLCGWLSGRDAKQERWLKEYPPKPAMYFVEDANLNDMAQLTGRTSRERAA